MGGRGSGAESGRCVEGGGGCEGAKGGGDGGLGSSHAVSPRTRARACQGCRTRGRGRGESSGSGVGRFGGRSEGGVGSDVSGRQRFWLVAAVCCVVRGSTSASRWPAGDRNGNGDGAASRLNVSLAGTCDPQVMPSHWRRRGAVVGQFGARVRARVGRALDTRRRDVRRASSARQCRRGDVTSAAVAATPRRASIPPVAPA